MTHSHVQRPRRLRSSPRIFGKVHSSSADMEEMVLNTAPVDDSGPGCDLVLELDEGFYGGLDTGRPE